MSLNIIQQNSMKIFFSNVIIFLIVLPSCSYKDKKEELELTLLNKEIVYFSDNSKIDSINIIKYKIKNNSDKTYLINNLTEEQELSEKKVFKNGANLSIYDEKNIEVNYEIKRYISENLDSENCVNFMIEDFDINEKRLKNNTNLKYFGLYERNNIFFIHPNETIQFQYIINLNRPIKFDGVREGYVNLNSRKEYYAKLSIASDSSNYKYVLPNDILNTIKDNNVKVYHGILKSTNTVPIKVLD
ncbi:hypothetical protein [Flavobacterium sp. KACC 22761]|uniref:hypothetical protein n=1 Tax=Flavobacterium sp. KACC 22761 TaxID=3092665 RepID=UPI002A750D27|nr:hypothetical protein [Flavobacterium sp. KACC 22761]WPO76866.1 hypothetical protein SCB73_11340 [Flavobacterium sp. KACC 22761]